MVETYFRHRMSFAKTGCDIVQAQSNGGCAARQLFQWLSSNDDLLDARCKMLEKAGIDLGSSI
jgi:hypothetical protein